MSTEPHQDSLASELQVFVVAGEGFVTLLFNFRGTGESQGNFHLLGWAEDLRAALDYLCLLPEVDPNRVSTLGFSGGAAVSIYVAAQDERIRSLVACASPANFDTLIRPELAQNFVEQARRLGIIREASFPQDLDLWLEEFRVVSPLRWVNRISPRPILLIHGLSDETIPVDHAYQLYARAGEPKDLSLLEGATHRLRQDSRTIPKAIEWLKEVNRRQSGSTGNESPLD